MYEGKFTKELLNLIDKHEEMFGFDPCAEIELEYGTDYAGFKADIELAIKEGKSISEMQCKYD